MNDDASENDDLAARIQLARDVVVLLRRTLNAFRAYPEGHDTRRAAMDDLVRAIRSFTARWEDLPLQITAKAFYFQDELLLADEREEDATTRPLFVDGIQELRFTSGCTKEEVSHVLSLWHAAVTSRFADGRSLATELWDADLKGIEIRSIESFSDGSEVDDPSVTSTASSGVRRVTGAAALFEEMSAEKLPGGRVTSSKGDRLVASSELVSLASAQARTMDDDVLERLAHAPRKVVDPLTPEERERLHNELTASAATLVRAHRTLWTLASDAAPDDEQKLAALVARVATRFLDDGAIDLLRQGLTQTLMAARLDINRASHIGDFLAPLASAKVVHPLVMALRDPARRDDAVAVLSFLHPSTLGLVLERLSDVVDDPAARVLVEQLVLRKSVALPLFGRAVSAATGRSAPQAVALLLDLAAKVHPKGLDQILPACLVHPSPLARTAGLARVPAEALPSVARSLADALGKESSNEVRREIHALLMRAKSPLAIEPMLALALRADLALDERQTYLRSIAAFGPAASKAAAAPLRQLFATEKDPLLRAPCALALGSMGDGESRSALESERRRIFGNRALKAACAEALKRLDARLAGGGSA